MRLSGIDIQQTTGEHWLGEVPDMISGLVIGSRNSEQLGELGEAHAV